MIRTVVAGLVLALSLVLRANGASTIHISEDFSSNPSSRWSVFGESSLFQWDSAAGNVRVTWDSAQPKSLFYIPIGRTVSRYDNFTFEFDLILDDIVSGNEEGKTGPMQIGIGFLNVQATNAAWSRVEWGGAPNVAEFNTYPSGYYPDWPVPPTTTPSFIASSGYGYLASLNDYMIALPLAETVHVLMDYNAESQTLKAVWTTNGVPVGQVHWLVLGQDILFGPEDDFAVDIFSISSYKSNEGEYADSVLAHGKVDNISITIPPPPPVVSLHGGFVEGRWEAVFRSRGDWSYALERSQDFASWSPVVENVPGSGTDMTLTDPNPPGTKAFYRVRATQ